jgi:hypothetical protein
MREYVLVHASVNGFYPPANVGQPSEKEVPDQFHLYPNYPNPFNALTVIPFDLPHSSHVTLEIFNLMGKKVRTLLADQKPAGHFEVQWDGTEELKQEVASGIYFCRLQAVTPSNQAVFQVQKLILLR